MRMPFTLLFFLYSTCMLTAQDWPQYMGPNRDGSAVTAGIFGEKVTLKQLWIQPLGSGFSGIAVKAGKVYTMHTNGPMDALSCFEAATGKKLWSFDYGPTFPRVGSSEPGPLSTPTIEGNRVYGLGAQGELFCVDAQNGKRIWARDIVKELGAVPWETGVTTSPMISGDFLVLNIGDRKDKSVAGFHKETGKLIWHHGAEKIKFQSPALVTLLGRKHLVALSESKLRGLNPATGEVLWEEASKDWVFLYGINDNLMLAAQFTGIALHEVSDHNGKMKITEKWYSKKLAIEYDMPVHHNGYLFGFRNFTLVCLRLSDGEMMWDTDEADRGVSILVGDHLAMISEDGIFRIARAWEKGYEERASIQVFEDPGLTEPSYADGVFYIRNYTHLAAIKVH